MPHVILVVLQTIPSRALEMYQTSFKNSPETSSAVLKLHLNVEIMVAKNATILSKNVIERSQETSKKYAALQHRLMNFGTVEDYASQHCTTYSQKSAQMIEIDGRWNHKTKSKTFYHISYVSPLPNSPDFLTDIDYMRQETELCIYETAGGVLRQNSL